MGLDSDEEHAAMAEPLRSLLFAPANVERHLWGVGRFGADAVVIDLEDAVPVAGKESARKLARQAIPDLARAAVWVRANGAATGLLVEDVEATAVPGLKGIMLPKSTADDVRFLDELLTAAEQRHGLSPRAFGILPLVETAAGVVEAVEIARAAPRVVTLVLGGGDLTRDLRIQAVQWSEDVADIGYAKGKVVVDARAADRAPPVDGPYIALSDLEGFRRECLHARRLGYQGKLCIHPSQVRVANEIFAPDPDEVDFAQRVVAAFEEAEAAGSTAFTVEGVFVDYAVVEKARHIVAAAEFLAEKDRGAVL